MKYVRLLTIWLATMILSTGLSLLLSSWIFNATVADRGIMKNWITASGIYEVFVDEVVSSSLSEVTEADQTIDPSLLQTAANKAFTPDLLQTSAESVLDGAYDWLDGSEESIEFTLDFTEAKSDYSGALGSLTQDKVDSLPACSPSQLAAMNAIDIFSLTCAPPAYIYQPAITQLQQEILTSEDFLPDPVITASDLALPLGGEGETIEDALPLAPPIYQLLQSGVIIAIGSISLSLVVLTLIAHDKLAVLRKAAKTLLGAALTAGLLTGFLYYLTSVDTAAPSTTTLVERVTEPLIKVIANDVLRISRVFTVVYLLLAIDCFVAYRILKKRRLKRSVT